MILSFLYIVFALIGFGFLVFIHELGHYVVARRQGIAIDVFSIGFGKPICSWKQNGVKWQISMIPLGGYVMFRGGDEKSGKSMYEMKDGFFAKSPWARIKVLLAGPLVNIAFAFVAFAGVWSLGGRAKPFEQYTKMIGAMDDKSELHELGVKPGDVIDKYNGHTYRGFQDLVYHGILKSEMMQISGDKIDYFTGVTTPYNYHLVPYKMDRYIQDFKSIGVIAPASYLIFRGYDQELGRYSPMWGSGIEEGDRILWANGELIFSAEQLKKVINQRSVVLTVRQNDELKTMRVPRVSVNDLALDAKDLGEFSDWKYEVGDLSGQQDAGFIPYEVDGNGFVRREYSFIDDDLIDDHYRVESVDDDFNILMEGDQIIAVGDTPVDSGLGVFKAVAKQDVMLIVKKGAGQKELVSWHEQDKVFRESVDWNQVRLLAKSLGKGESAKEMGDYRVVGPIAPVTFSQFYKNAGIKEPEMSPEVKERLNLSTSEFIFLGSKIGGEEVLYNPNPVAMMQEGMLGTARTLSSLFTGNLSPKWLSGPVGMFKIMHDGWSVGLKEVLFWMGLISLNLGLFNLLPLPVLDGGRILLSVWEWVTKKRISEKTMEVILLPFFVLLVAVFLYTTYHDVLRLIGK